MSAIVYGITKPPACIYYDEKNNCDVRCQCLRDDDLCCLHNKETRKKLYSASWNDQYAMCPIKSIPTPHGRLIDADRFLDWLKEFHTNDVVIMSGVKNARTVIEAEVSE
jgi:hypothetical protein